MANENIAHQKEYEYLKEQFFKPIAPNKYFAEEASIIRGQYNEGQALNMNQLGSSLSNEYSGLSHQNYADVRTQNHPIMPMYV